MKKVEDWTVEIALAMAHQQVVDENGLAMALAAKVRAIQADALDGAIDQINAEVEHWFSDSEATDGLANAASRIRKLKEKL